MKNMDASLGSPPIDSSDQNIPPTGSPDRILIVEPDANTRNMITHLLQGMGYSCTPVPDGLEAMRALKAHSYDLLITEIDMPGNEELELVQTAARSTPAIPVIICTTHPSLDLAVAPIQLSVTAFLVKPVASDTLIDLVRKSIDSYRSLRKYAEMEEELRNYKETVDQADILLISTLQDTIQILESTRRSFKSKKLAALRRKLTRILVSKSMGQEALSRFNK